jgi:hypothetical protein
VDEEHGLGTHDFLARLDPGVTEKIVDEPEHVLARGARPFATRVHLGRGRACWR